MPTVTYDDASGRYILRMGGNPVQESLPLGAEAPVWLDGDFLPVEPVMEYVEAIREARLKLGRRTRNTYVGGGWQCECPDHERYSLKPKNTAASDTIWRMGALGEVVCNDCLTHASICPICHMSHVAEGNPVYKGLPVCHNCRSLLKKCSICGKHELQENLLHVHSFSMGSEMYICKAHPELIQEYSSSCTKCNTNYSAKDVKAHGSNNHKMQFPSYCPNCYQRVVRRCPNCNQFYDAENGRNGMCRRCDGEQNPIASYGHTTHLKHYTIKDEPLCEHYGVELEVEGPNADKAYRVAKDLRALLSVDVADVKRDGSLQTGFEIAYAPMSLAYAQANKEKLFVLPMEFLMSQKFRSHDTKTCGLHIHVSRTVGDRVILGTGSPAELKLEALLYAHDKMYLPLFRRAKGGYCREKAAMLDRRDRDRYNAVNVRNAATVELRRPRGTLNDHTILATIELWAAMVAVATDNAVSIQRIIKHGWNLLLEELAFNRERYIHAREYCMFRGIALPETKSKTEEERG